MKLTDRHYDLARRAGFLVTKYGVTALLFAILIGCCAGIIYLAPVL